MGWEGQRDHQHQISQAVSEREQPPDVTVCSRDFVEKRGSGVCQRHSQEEREMWKMQGREGLPREGQLSPCSPRARSSTLQVEAICLIFLHLHYTPPSPNSVSSISWAVSKYLQKNRRPERDRDEEWRI